MVFQDRIWDFVLLYIDSVNRLQQIVSLVLGFGRHSCKGWICRIRRIGNSNAYCLGALLGNLRKCLLLLSDVLYLPRDVWVRIWECLPCFSGILRHLRWYRWWYAAIILCLLAQSTIWLVFFFRYTHEIASIRVQTSPNLHGEHDGNTQWTHGDRSPHNNSSRSCGLKNHHWIPRAAGIEHLH